MQHLGDNLGPTMQEVNPTVFDEDIARFGLAMGLVHEVQFTPVVKLPGDAVNGE